MFSGLMFSALSKVVGYLWKDESDDEDDKSQVNNANSLATLCEQNSQKEEDTNINKKPEKASINSHTANTQGINGQVTHIFDTNGLIDGHIYFSFENVSGDQTVVLGDHVTGTAVQEHEDGGWHADKVLVSNNHWDEDQEHSHHYHGNTHADTVVGIVTELSQQCGFINGEYLFEWIDEKTDDLESVYKPFVGDYVTADLQKSQTSERVTATNLFPLRQTEKQGKITGALPDHGYIDGDVYFQYDICAKGYRPQKWDPVKYVAIESRQGKNSWRAISIQPVVETSVRRYGITSFNLSLSPLQTTLV